MPCHLSRSFMHYSVRHGLKKLVAEARHFSWTPQRATYFIIVSQERTGSTLLSTLMSYHPRILTDMDIFYTPETWSHRRRAGRRLFTTRPIRGYKFKVTHTPLQSSVDAARTFLYEEEQSGLHIIRLQRHNILRQAISSYMCGKRNELHAWKDRGQRQSRNRVTIDVEDVLGRMRYFDRLTRFQDRALKDIPHLHISYESDLFPSDRHQATADRIFRYLGLSPHPVDTRLRKLTPNNLSKVVANVGELRHRLEGTRFASYLAQNGDPHLSDVHSP